MEMKAPLKKDNYLPPCPALLPVIRETRSGRIVQQPIVIPSDSIVVNRMLATDLLSD